MSIDNTLADKLFMSGIVIGLALTFNAQTLLTILATVVVVYIVTYQN